MSSRVNSVGLLKAQSPWLRRDNVFLGILLQSSVLSFTGSVELRVLAGLVHCNGFIMKPSAEFHSLYSLPMGHPCLSISPPDPTLQDEEFSKFLAPFAHRRSLHFHEAALQGQLQCQGKGCLFVDVGKEDIAQLNALVAKDWSMMNSLVLLRAAQGHLIPTLCYWESTLFNNKVSQAIPGFATVTGRPTLSIPKEYMEIAWELVSQEGVKVLVCGESNSGKSSLCRFIINYMLNRYPMVCYLECDPGQPELTVPEVLSLHTLTSPLLGPPYTHFRTPHKGYYYGDKSPQVDPEYYLSILKSLNGHYLEEVRSKDVTVPLVINTCGWVTNMGVQLFLDIVRTLSPSHIVRSLTKMTVDLSEGLPPLTAQFLSKGEGLFRAADLTPFTEQTPADGDIEMYCSSDEALSLNGSSSESEANSDSEVLSDQSSTSGELPSSRAQKGKSRKRKKLKLSKGKFSLRSEDNSGATTISMRSWLNRGWKTVDRYKIYYFASVAGAKKSSQSVRRLGYIAYFSDLLPASESVAKQLGLPNHFGNMLQYAPPLMIDWSDVAVHILHRKVPNSQSLYALNAKIVSLGRVDEDQFTERIPEYPDMVRFLKTNTPLIEFIGLGLVRGIDMEKKKFIVTTPICTRPQLLSQVNVLTLGHPDHVDFFADSAQAPTTETPYMVKGYESLLGMYSWKNKCLSTRK